MKHPLMKYLKEQESQVTAAANTSLRKRHSYVPLDFDTRVIRQVLKVQPEDIVPAITNHNRQKWIPWLGIFISPFSMKNWRKRKPDAQSRHAGNRNQANQRKSRKQHHGPEQWTSNWTTTTPYNYQQWDSMQEHEAWDQSHSDEQQYKRQRGNASSCASGSTSYSGPQHYGGGSSSSSSTPWNSAWGNWYGDQHWHGPSW